MSNKPLRAALEQLTTAMGIAILHVPKGIGLKSQCEDAVRAAKKALAAPQGQQQAAGVDGPVISKMETTAAPMPGRSGEVEQAISEVRRISTIAAANGTQPFWEALLTYICHLETTRANDDAWEALASVMPFANKYWERLIADSDKDEAERIEPILQAADEALATRSNLVANDNHQDEPQEKTHA